MPEFSALDMAGPALDVPLWTLRLTKKTEILTAAGYPTVAKLLAGFRKGVLPAIPGVGGSTVEDARRKLSILSAVAAEGSGAIDWERYAVLLGLELVPAEHIVAGPDFIAAFADVTDAVIRSRSSAVEQLILTERLLKQPGDRLTLEQIAQRAVPVITRERVRQLERRLIDALSDALLLDDCRDLPFWFRTDFADRWKAAARLFSDQSEISFGAFMAGLEDVWGVSYDDLLPHLPLITSILTSQATLPPQLRPAVRLHPRLYGEIDENLLVRPAGWLALGRSGVELQALGFETIGDLVAAARADRLPPATTKAGAVARRSLNALADAIDSAGGVDWPGFGADTGLQAIPPADRGEPAEFLRSLNGDLEEVVRVTGTSGRAAGIFRMRTSVPASVRPTLERTARALGGHASTIKREESDLLTMLHEQLVTGDFLRSRILYPPGFLARWRDARRLFARRPADFEQYCACLADEWNLPAEFVRLNAEGLWAVLSRYPSTSRTARRARRSRPLPLPAAFTGGTIVLRGFRRAH